MSARAMLARFHAAAAAGEWVPPSAFAWAHLGLREVDAALRRQMNLQP